ncbi:MAG: DUF3486 family protein [Thermodesulfobacteriota bacterium]|nr:MAG: DUF3486 family protein [Thermodesulfobacteriota bacterium]
MPKVRQHSRVSDELPPEILAEVNRLFLEPGVTYDDIYEFATEKGYDISRSAFGRYGKRFLATYQRLRIVEDQSKALVSQAGEGMVLEETISKLLAENLINLLIDGKVDLEKIPKLMGEFAKLQSSTVMRERFKVDVKEKAKKLVKDAEKNAKTMTKDELVNFIKERVYGLV